MKFLIVILLASMFLSKGFAHEDWNLGGFSVEKTMGAEFIKHQGESPYLSFELQYEPIKQFLEKVDRFSYQPLKSRGEAHVTVITPPEFTDDLSKYVSIEEIENIAQKLKIQNSSYKPICIGHAAVSQDSLYLENYFIVIESQDLLHIRQEIANLYKSRGGMKFDPTHFYPHITLGFTDRDLYEADGVVKDQHSCLKTLHISPTPSKISGLPVPNSSYVDQGKKGGALIRGNAPLNHSNLEAMKEMGISQVIIFKNDKAGEIKSEMAGLRKLGLAQDRVTHIDFDWKDNEDFSSGCKKIISGIDLMKRAMRTNQKLFFHCTTGEDRTGILSASYLLSQKKNANIKKIFKSEMCDKGYEAGDPDKDKEVVERIRSGLTKTFLKTAFRIDEAKKKHLPINEKICSNDPSNSQAYNKYATQMNFTCGSELAKE